MIAGISLATYNHCRTATPEGIVFDQYLDANEAAQRLKVHPETVKRLIRMGDLPARKFGNKWLIDRDVLEQFAGTYIPGPGAKRRLL